MGLAGSSGHRWYEDAMRALETVRPVVQALHLESTNGNLEPEQDPFCTDAAHIASDPEDSPDTSAGAVGRGKRRRRTAPTKVVSSTGGVADESGGQPPATTVAAAAAAADVGDSSSGRAEAAGPVSTAVAGGGRRRGRTAAAGAVAQSSRSSSKTAQDVDEDEDEDGSAELGHGPCLSDECSSREEKETDEDDDEEGDDLDLGGVPAVTFASQRQLVDASREQASVLVVRSASSILSTSAGPRTATDLQQATGGASPWNPLATAPPARAPIGSSSVSVDWDGVSSRQYQGTQRMEG